MESSTCCARKAASPEDSSRTFEADITKDINTKANPVPRSDRCSSCGGTAKRDQSFRTSDRRNVCNLCERLRGYDYSNAADSKERFVRRTKHKNRVSLTKRDRLQAYASDNYVSSVVRWNLFRWSREKRTTVWLILFLSIMVSSILATETPTKADKDGVCQSLDIRNHVENFSELKGCRIIEGSLQILLMERSTPSDFINMSFPELTEITEFLMFYRVPGLLSIGRLFPNLMVIRGQSLFMDHALIIIEMMNLQEVGLYNLMSITRGGVIIDNSPALCYADTIDWDLIAKGVLITANKPRNSCPVCDKRCPQRHNKKNEHLCWNHEHCQKVCPPECPNACDENGTCCDPSCLAKCKGPTNRDCAICKNVTTVENECTNKCPNGTFMFMNYRCIDEDTCRKMKVPREVLDVNVKKYPYKPFEGNCVMECPAGYTDDKIDGKTWCKKCDGLCQKKCPGTNVDNIAKAQSLRGCTHITGSLEIQIRGGKNIVKELEDSLSSIEEINGCLKIVRSFPLISLNFLKNLRMIRGNDTNYKYSLTVMDNQNLQELWDWDQHKEIQILAGNGSLGKVFFHFNPKLCYYKIEMLRKKANLAPFEDIEVAPNSNGDKVPCNVTVLRTWITKRSPVSAVVEWEPFIHHDTRSLLSYVVYFIEAQNKNVTLYDGRDACGGDGWKVDDVPASNDVMYETSKLFSHFLTQLRPYTQYAYYVKTYTIATERSGAQSNLTYFRTNADAPSQPRVLEVHSKSSSEALMTWWPPQFKNGNLTLYEITGRWHPDDPIFLNQRNFCDEPMLLSDKTAIPVPDKDTKRVEEGKWLEDGEHAAPNQREPCECNDREVDQTQREKEVSSAIAFEDALHNQVYIKRKLPTSRKKRETVGTDIPQKELDLFIKDKMFRNDTIEFLRKVPSTNHSFVMKNLRHFATYHMEVRACRAAEPEDTERSKRCSTWNVRSLRTLPKDTADNIPPDSFRMTISGENNSLTMVTLQWDEPPDPNGLITTYHIEYRREDIKNYKPTLVCVTRQDFMEAKNSYVLKELPSGNYSVRVQATSLAGNGNFTSKKYFYIKENNMLSVLWVMLSLVAFFIVVTLGFAYYICIRKYLTNGPLIATVNPEYVSAQYMLDEWEVPRERIELLKSLGTGTFGMVYEGIARDIVKGKSEVRCAVKTVNNDATNRERIAFLNEASVMKGFNTHHVVKLLGVVTRTQPTLVIMELMVNGDLKRYLRSHRPNENRCNPPKLDRILRMAIEIADGMAYLSTKKFVHRDLAARNCMVAEDLTVKVGDFGMTRDIYETDYYRKGSKGLLPVRWMAPESLKDGIFSVYSDVWSYGVVLWEMVTLASQPYLGLSNEEVLRFVMEGNVMNRPENCPHLLYKLMKCTWEFKDIRRPTFLDIVSMLLRHINLQSFQEVSFYHSTEGIEARKSLQQIDQQQELTSLQDLQEEELESEENSPLHQDFDDFASIDPNSIKNSFSSHFRMDSYGENSKATTNCHDMNSSSIPLKASFDGISSDLITSNKDALSLPFVEDSLKSMRSSPLTNAKSVSRSNLSQLSTSNKSVSPKNPSKRSYLSSPNSLKLSNPDYGKGSPEILSVAVKSETVPLRIDFPPMDGIDDDNGIERKQPKSPVEYVNKPETLNNGYIGSTTT